MVHYALCDDQKTKIFETENVCFASIGDLLTYVINPETTHYIHYKPKKYQKGKELSDIFTLWFCKLLKNYYFCYIKSEVYRIKIFWN